MRVAGPRRCVVWPNIFHLSLRFDYTALNLVLAEQDLRFENLRSFDWHAMVAENSDWLVDPVHVNARGHRARAKAAALAREVRACRRSLRRAQFSDGSGRHRRQQPVVAAPALAARSTRCRPSLNGSPGSAGATTQASCSSSPSSCPGAQPA